MICATKGGGVWDIGQPPVRGYGLVYRGSIAETGELIQFCGRFTRRSSTVRCGRNGFLSLLQLPHQTLQPAVYFFPTLRLTGSITKLHLIDTIPDFSWT